MLVLLTASTDNLSRSSYKMEMKSWEDPSTSSPTDNLSNVSVSSGFDESSKSSDSCLSHMEVSLSVQPLLYKKDDKQGMSVGIQNTSTPDRHNKDDWDREALDEPDAAVVLQMEDPKSTLRAINRQSAMDPSSLRGIKWLGWNPNDETDDMQSDHTQLSRPRSVVLGLVPHMRMILICLYCVIYIAAMCLFPKCSGPTSHGSSANDTCEHPVWMQVVRSFKFPLISIVGVIVISFFTRLVLFACALCTWRCPTKEAAKSTLKPFMVKRSLVPIVCTGILVGIVYLLSALAFKEELTFEWEEVFAPAGLATIITVCLDIEGETDFEKIFKLKDRKDGYTYGLAHTYFTEKIEPFLEPNGKRQLIFNQWEMHNPSETLLVLLVESRHLIEEVFTKQEFSEDVSFLETSDGLHLMKLRLGTKDSQFVYLNCPVLLNEDLLSVKSWFETFGRTFVPLEEQKREYVNMLKKLLKKKNLPVGGALGRVFFLQIPHEDIRSIPGILRKSLFSELGSPNSEEFRKNTEVVKVNCSLRRQRGSVLSRSSQGSRSSRSRDSALSWSTASSSA